MEISRKLHGNEYLPATSINAIDHSKEMRAIREEFGTRYFDRKEAVAAAADLWNMPCNEFGVITERSEPLIIHSGDRYSVEITPSASPSGQYLIGVDTQTPISGFCYAPSVFVSLGYQSKQDANLAGIYEAGGYLYQRLKNPCSCSSESYAKGLEDLLKELQQATQPTLF